MGRNTVVEIINARLGYFYFLDHDAHFCPHYKITIKKNYGGSVLRAPDLTKDMSVFIINYIELDSNHK